jgi:hypothetical protein
VYLDPLAQLVLQDQLVLTPRLRVQQDQLVQLVRKVTRALEFKFLVLTTQFKNLKQLSQQETQARDT